MYTCPSLICMYVCMYVYVYVCMFQGRGKRIAFSEICGIVCPAGKLSGPSGS